MLFEFIFQVKNWMKKRLPADLNWIILEAASTCQPIVNTFLKAPKIFHVAFYQSLIFPMVRWQLEVKNTLVLLLNAALSSEKHVYKMVRNFVTVISSFQEERKKSKECHLYSFTFYLFFANLVYILFLFIHCQQFLAVHRAARTFTLFSLVVVTGCLVLTIIQKFCT